MCDDNTMSQLLAGARVRTELHNAAEDGNTARCQRLLQSGADIHAQAGNGWTALHLSAFNGHVTTCEILLHSGAVIEQM